MATQRTYLVDWVGGEAGADRSHVDVLADDGTNARVQVGNTIWQLRTEALADGSLVVVTTDEATGRQTRRVVDSLVGPGSAELLSRGRSWVARVQAERDTWLRTGAGGAAGGGTISVSMPGRVVKVLVAIGDEVAVGQPVLIIEAMKMENEVKAAAAGTVRAVLVQEGVSVEAGQPLVELDVAEPA